MSETVLRKLSLMNVIIFYGLVPTWVDGKCFVKVPMRKEKPMVTLMDLVPETNNIRRGRLINGKYFYRVSSLATDYLNFTQSMLLNERNNLLKELEK